MIKHAEVLAAIAQGKEVEFKMVYSDIKYEWEVPDNLECINPLSHPHDEWRIKADSPKLLAWDELSGTLFHNLQHAFNTGWTASLVNQLDHHGMDEDDFVILDR